MTNPTSCAEPATDFPRRIVCLTDETTETLYLLGEQDRIVGVSGFTQRPPEARSKPRVSAFRDADINAILDLHPDLVFTFSDVQAEITRQLILRGVAVLNFNQRDIAGIFDMVRAVSRLVGKPAEGEKLIAGFRDSLRRIQESALTFPHRPAVFFEEWKDPLISGIGWVEELIGIAGGDALFPELIGCGKAQDRVVDPDEVARRDPEVILASWCGMRVDKDAICARPGWKNLRAVRNGHVYEIPSSVILQPGPAALTEGVRQIHYLLTQFAGIDVAPELRPVNSRDRTLR